MNDGLRWRQRSLPAAAIRFVVLCLPIVVSVVCAWAVHRLLPPASGLPARVGYLVVLVGVSTLVLVVADRLARRLLPLATLLELSLLFPDRAPSRLAVARQAIRRRPIEAQLERIRAVGADPGAVAREILTLVAALSAHDRPTRGHAERVRMYTDLLSDQLGLPGHDRDLLRWAAILHDIGKLEVPPSLLNKPGRPNAQEWTVLQAHPVRGAEIAAGLLPWLGSWADVIEQHHERFDGTGYPAGLCGDEIGLGARIVSVADAYDVMTAARAYRRPVSRAAALHELVAHAGTQFDPEVVRAMIDVGVPRLRRAQGVLAWLADIPIVSSGTVPAATLARAVGVGVLATGAAVTSGAPAAAVAPSTQVATSPLVPSPRSPATDVATAPAAASTSTPTPGGEPLPDEQHQPVPGSSPASSPTPPVTQGLDREVGTVTSSVAEVATGAVGTARETAEKAVGTATATVTKTVKDTTGTVTDAVGRADGAATDAVDDVTVPPLAPLLKP